MSTFKLSKDSHLKQPMFFGEPVDIQRFDNVKYPHIEQLNRTALGMHWVPEEIDLSRDKIDYKNLHHAGKHAFTANLKRQIVLDSLQGRGPALTLLRVCSLPELECFINTWNFFEGAIHSRSYTHIIRNVMNDPSEVFDEMREIQEVIGFTDSISKYYDDFINYTNIIEQDGYSKKNTKRLHQKKLWLLLHAINALEGIRFYFSFACSWAFAENKQMVGNADIIKLIARDENIHLAFTQWTIKKLPEEDPVYKEIAEECEEEVREIFESAIQEEKDFSKYAFKYGSIIGMNVDISCNYLDWLGTKRMRAIGLKRECAIKSNPLPWTLKWINSGDDDEDSEVDVQTAAQEKELTDYLIGAIDDDVESDTFSTFDLG